MTSKLEQLQLNFRPINEEERPNDMNKSGVYAIWWKDNLPLLQSLNRTLYIKGKAVSKSQALNSDGAGTHHIHKTVWDWNLEKKPVCLYVGKTHNIRNRIRQHLLANTNWHVNETQTTTHEDITDENKFILYKKNTSCQLRAGIEHLYKNQPSCPLNEKLKNIVISYILEDSFKERFYLENLAIGYYRPWFNLDSER